ncbi:TPA: ABC transporter ATP-binding protein, partial [Streptococcus suis]
MENKIRLNNINFAYRGNEKLLNGVNLEILKGQCFAIVGGSGCGKSTLTRVINGLIPSFYQGDLEGEVFIDNKNLRKLNTWEIGSLVGNVFQDPRSQFFANEVAGEIAFGCENLGLSHDEIVDRVHKSAKEMNILDLLNASIYTLSYGMRQRVAICSAKAMQPDI